MKRFLDILFYIIYFFGGGIIFLSIAGIYQSPPSLGYLAIALGGGVLLFFLALAIIDYRKDKKILRYLVSGIICSLFNVLFIVTESELIYSDLFKGMMSILNLVIGGFGIIIGISQIGKRLRIPD